LGGRERGRPAGALTQSVIDRTSLLPSGRLAGFLVGFKMGFYFGAARHFSLYLLIQCWEKNLCRWKAKIISRDVTEGRSLGPTKFAVSVHLSPPTNAGRRFCGESGLGCSDLCGLLATGNWPKVGSLQPSPVFFPCPNASSRRAHPLCSDELGVTAR